jgi:hypothetical protein
MIADYPCCRCGRHLYDIRSLTIRMESSKSGLKKPYVANSGSTTSERQEPIMECQSIALVNPERFPHLASEWRVLR